MTEFVKPDSLTALETHVNGLEVPDMSTETYSPLLQVLINCKKQIKDLEAQREKALAPAKETVARIREYFEPALSQLKRIEQDIRVSACNYLDDCTDKRLTDSQAGLVVDDLPPQVKGIGKREVWDFEITDPEDLPEEFKSPNLKAIKEYLKKEEHPLLAGVQFFRKTTLIVRA